MRALVVSVLTIILLVVVGALAPTYSYAVDCTSPGAGSSSDYPYDSAVNTYVICTILSAEATIMAYTPTPTPTLLPTPAAIATLTGCTPNQGNDNIYRDCVISDVNARADSHTAWWLPVVAVAILAVGIILHR